MAVRNLQDLGEKLRNIVTRLMANDDLVKLLYYSDDDPLNHENLTKEQKREFVFNKLIKVLPRVGPKENAQSILVITIMGARKNPVNGEFKEITIRVESFVPLEQWIIKGDSLRPFYIMGEVEESLNRKRIDGLGQINSEGFELNFLTEEISCYLQLFTITLYD